MAQALLGSTAPARLAHSRTDGTPRMVPIGFHWNGTEILGTPADAPKRKVLRDARLGLPSVEAARLELRDVD